jgi:hypothetical protein
MAARLRDLGVVARLAAFAVVLALIGGVAALAGAATGDGGATASGQAASGDMGMDAMSPAELAQANGLATDAGGYSFVPVQATLPLGRKSAFRFRILDTRGQAVSNFDLDGGVRLHLIVVRRDFVGYQHLHPQVQADGSWSVPLELAAPGDYRAFADFELDGTKTVLGHDLFVRGQFAPVRLPAVSSSETADGYAVDLTHGELHAGKEAELRFTVSRNGQPVQSFQSYVGHRGHLVALRDGDLAYSHIHPHTGGDAGQIVFDTELPTAGSYRLFLQFKRGGVVHTAPFTIEVQR